MASFSNYDNNVFQTGYSHVVTNSNFQNNISVSPNGSGNLSISTLHLNWDTTFINPGAPDQNNVHAFNNKNNYRVRPTSPAKNSGTDGTDRGLFGGTFPWVDGSIPSNPHIYFKKVDAQTGADGKLRIQFKVRTN